MQIHLFEAGARPGERAVDLRLTVQHAVLRIGGAAPCEVVVEGLPPEPVAEIRVAAGDAELANVGGQPVRVGGREVAKGASQALGSEVLLSVGGRELVYRAQPGGGGPSGSGEAPIAPGASRPSGEAAAEEPSVAAKSMLKQVYQALGVPEDNPALVVYDEGMKIVKRVDLAPPADEAAIGRHPDNRVVLYHPSVSKRHTRVWRARGGFMVEDAGSRNGTLLNGEPLQRKAKLQSGDRIRVGQFTIRFVDPKKAMEELADSVPDLKRIDAAGPGERVRLGGAGDLEETTGVEHNRPAAPGPAPPAAPASGAAAPPAAGEASDGLGFAVYLPIAIGVLVLAGIGLAIFLFVL